MRSTKFYQIISELSLADLNRFEKFLASPYFNVNRLNTDIFRLCLDLYKDPKVEFSKEDTWKVVKGGEAYDDARFRKYLSELLKLLLQFFSQEELDSNQMLKSQLLLEYTNKKRIPKLVNTAIQSSQNASDKYYDRSSNYYLYHFQIEKNLFYLQGGNIELFTKKNVEDIAQNLDKFFIAEKLKYYCEILARKGLSNISYDFNFINELIYFVEINQFENELIIQIYYLIYKTLVDPNDRSHFFKARELIFNNYRLFDGNDLQELFDSLLTYSTAQINLGHNDFFETLIEIYDFIFEKGILLNENYMTPVKFKNVITTSLRAGNYDFAENFIKEYQELLPLDQRDSIVTFSLAQIYFYKKSFKQVIEQLQKVEYPDLFTNLRAKTIYLATLLELKEYDAIASWAESFRAFLNRKRRDIPDSKIVTYLNFITIVKLITIIELNNSRQFENVESELDKYTGNIVNEQWLRDKLAERKKSLSSRS